jgi:nucleotide-binding universal stress UspA family protein
MELKKVLVPIDFSNHSDQALRWGTSLAEKYGAQVLLLHVIPPAVEEVSTHGSASEEIIMDLEAKVEARLGETVLRDLDDSLPVDVKIAVGKAPEEILRVAREEAVGLIVMGTHGRTGLAHVLLGSTAETVLRSSPCPVFTVRADAEVTP